MSAQRKPEKKEPLKEYLKADDASLFSQLTYLLSLVTTINSEEALPSSFHPNAIIASNDAREEFTLLDSIAAILWNGMKLWQFRKPSNGLMAIKKVWTRSIKRNRRN